MAPAQAQKHLTHNEAIVAIDERLQLRVDALQADPPAAPHDGQVFAIARPASGDWAEQDDQIARRQNDGWTFTETEAGWLATVGDTGEVIILRNDGWAVYGSRQAQLGIGTDADETNRLSVSSPSVLFNHAGDDCRVAINRDSTDDVATILFQTNFSGRAEIGLSSQGNLVFRSSPDGASWSEALSVNPSNGDITIPGDLSVGGEAVLTTDTEVMELHGFIAPNTDLDTLTTTGFHHQISNSGAAAGANYPVNRAGMLQVIASQNMVYQQYHVFSLAGVDANKLFVRGSYFGNFGPWREI